MSFINFDSQWFQFYSRAILTEDPHALRGRVNDALNVISETLRGQHLEEDERQAVSAAAYSLQLLKGPRLATSCF